MTHSSETKLQQSTPRLAASSADGSNAGLRPPRLLVPVIAGLAIIAVGFGGFVTWASTAPLVSAAVAPGIVAVDGKRRVVEHLEGGYVHDILVREGDRVVEGQPLLRIDTAQSGARLDQLDSRVIALTAERDRLRAEIDEVPSIAFAQDLQSRAGEAEVANAMDLQTQLFSERMTAFQNTVDVADSAITEARQEIHGLDAQLKARASALSFLEEREGSLAELVKKGYSTNVQLSSVRTELATIKADIAALDAARTGATERVKQRQAERERLDTNTTTEAAARLQVVERELNEAHESFDAAADTVRRSEVTASITGRVVGLTVTTEGAVVDAGETLMEIVPENEELVVDVMIDPADIEAVYPGLPVNVRLTAYSMRTTAPIPGTLTQISADRILDARTGTAIYRGIVSLDETAIAEMPDLKLYPGMSTETLIRTGEKTLMGYLFDPLFSSMNRAMIDT